MNEVLIYKDLERDNYIFINPRTLVATAQLGINGYTLVHCAIRMSCIQLPKVSETHLREPQAPYKSSPL